MGFFTPVDHSEFPAPQSAYGWRIYLLAISAGFGGGMFGYDVAFIGNTIGLPSFKSDFGITTTNATALSSNIVSVFLAGAFFGSFLSFPLVNQCGRKVAILCGGTLFLVGSIVAAAAKDHLASIYACRVLAGLGVGFASQTVPLYISECAPPGLRGRLTGIFECQLQTWQIVGFWINYGVKKHISATSSTQWRIPMALQIAPAGILLITMVFQPETPRFLLTRGRQEEAAKVIANLRGVSIDDPYVEYELGSIKAQLEQDLAFTNGDPSLRAKINQLRQPTNLKRLGIGMALMTFLATTGINSVNYFSTRIISSLGFTGTDATLLGTGFYGLVKCAANVIYFFFFIDKVGRRKPLLVGSVLTVFTLFAIAIYEAVSKSYTGSAPKDGGAYFALVMIYFYAVFLAMSWSGLPWIYCSEIFRTGVRPVATTITTATQWLVQFALVYASPYMINTMTYGVFLFFGLWTVIAGIFVYFFVPETQGISLEDMETLWSQPGFAATKRRRALQILADARDEKTAVDEKVEF